MSETMSEAATAEYSEATKTLGDQIVGLTLKEAKELSDYLKDEHGIEPATIQKEVRDITERVRQIAESRAEYTVTPDGEITLNRDEIAPASVIPSSSSWPSRASRYDNIECASSGS